jgi:long-chain fatty acid transport protein
MKSIWIALFALLLFCGKAMSITDDEIFQQFQFNFATPGARANAMGRAFIGLADDATAAETNPAGLVILTKPEVSFEYKNTSYSILRFRSLEDSGESVNTPSYLSVVYPQGSWRFAFFRQVFLDYKESFALEAFSPPGTNISFPPAAVSGDFQGVNYGGAVAYQFSTKFLIGGSAKLSHLDLETARTLPFVASLDEGDSGFSMTLGTLFNPNGKVSVGAVYERNAEFDFVKNQFGVDFPFTVKIPDRFGLGVAIRPTSQFTIVSDLDFIQYSQLADNFKLTLFTSDIKATDFDIDNGVEFHLGAEEVLRAGSHTVALRGGFFSNPDHALQYLGPTNTGTQIAVDAFFNRRDRSTQYGYTFGGGMTFGVKFQIDAAYVISDPFNEFSLSAVYRF